MWMQLGSAGPLLRSWQQFLIAQKFLQAAELVSPGEAAGEVFGDATAAATRAYQERRGLVADGIVGEQTLRKAREDGYSAVAVLPEYSLLYGLRSGASDDWEHPAALVHAPPGFDPAAPAVVVYLHGIDNNIENVVRAAPLSPQYPVADLLGQLLRARRNAILVVPELHYNWRTPDPGRLGAPGSLRSLLTEILEEAQLPPPLAGLRLAELGRVVLISHSGGYHAAAAMALCGGVRVDELYLLDSLYGHEGEFAAFVTETLTEIAAGEKDEAGLRRARRLVNLYTRSTAELSRAQAHKARAEVQRLQLPKEWVAAADDEPLSPEELPDLLADPAAGPRVLIRRVAVAHSEIPLRFIEGLLQHSGLGQTQT